MTKMLRFVVSNQRITYFICAFAQKQKFEKECDCLFIYLFTLLNSKKSPKFMPLRQNAPFINIKKVFN